jgi:hypothetical protein
MGFRGTRRAAISLALRPTRRLRERRSSRSTRPVRSRGGECFSAYLDGSQVDRGGRAIRGTRRSVLVSPMALRRFAPTGWARTITGSVLGRRSYSGADQESMRIDKIRAAVAHYSTRTNIAPGLVPTQHIHRIYSPAKSRAWPRPSAEHCRQRFPAWERGFCRGAEWLRLSAVALRSCRRPPRPRRAVRAERPGARYRLRCRRVGAKAIGDRSIRSGSLIR